MRRNPDGCYQAAPPFVMAVEWVKPACAGADAGFKRFTGEARASFSPDLLGERVGEVSVWF